MKHLVNDWIKTCNLPDIFVKASNEFSWQVVKLVFLSCNIPVDKYMWAGQFHFLSATLGSLIVDSPCRLSTLMITFPFHSLYGRFWVNIFQVSKEFPDLLPYSPVRTFVGSLSRLRKPPKKSNFRTGYQILKYFEIYLFHESKYDIYKAEHNPTNPLYSVLRGFREQCKLFSWWCVSKWIWSQKLYSSPPKISLILSINFEIIIW